MSAKIWFITGTSRGFGREWALAPLERGDSVVATARNASSLDTLVAAHGDAVLPISLDVTNREAVFAAVARAHEHFGRLDVVVNNAGYGQFGMVEELSEAEAREQIETNLFGALWVTKGGAAVPAGPGQRSLPAGLLHRRSLRVPHRRHLPRVEVGAGRSEPITRAGGRGLRHQSHPHRARRLLHRLGRQLGQARHGAARLRRGP